MGGFYRPGLREQQRMRRRYSVSDLGITAAVSDPYFANVVTLLHLDGTHGSTTFTDVKGKTYTPPGTATLSTAAPRFGSAALDASSTGGRIETSSHTDFNMGTGDFTFDLWWSPTDAYTGGVYPTLFNYGYVSAGGLLVQASTPTSGAFVFYLGGVAVCTESSGVTSGSGFHFYEFNRTGTTVRIFRDGVQTASGTSSASITSATNLEVGGAFNGGGHKAGGIIDDFRVTKGVCRNTANYTPPTSAHSDS